MWTKTRFTKGKKCQTTDQGSAFNALLQKMNELTEKLTDVQNRVNIIESPANETGTQADVNSAATDEATPQSVRLDADLQQRIDQHLRELDISDHDSDEDERLPARGKSRPLRSERDKTATECVSVTVEWPHCSGEQTGARPNMMSSLFLNSWRGI